MRLPYFTTKPPSGQWIMCIATDSFWRQCIFHVSQWFSPKELIKDIRCCAVDDIVLFWTGTHEEPIVKLVWLFFQNILSGGTGHCYCLWYPFYYVASEYGRFKKLCCIPYFVIVIFVVLCFVVGLCLFLVFRAKNLTEPGYTVIDSVLITLAIIVGLTILGHVYKWAHMMLNLVISPKRRINKISQQLNSLKIEGVMQNLKKEVS